MTASIITIFDREGNILDDFEAQVEREWLLNEYGLATWTMARTDPKCTERLLRFGNRVLIQSNADDDAGAMLPDWAGVIDPPREWGDHDVTVTAYSGEYLFTWRRGPGEKTLKITDTPGGIFRRLLTYANAPEDLLIREGDIFENGGAQERAIEVHEMYTAITALAEDTGMEWGIEHAFSGGRLYLVANWWEQRGVASNYALEEGKNVKFSGRPLSEQDTIVNDVLAYSNTMVGWNANRVVVRQNADSIARFGLRQSALQVQANEGDKTAVTAAADAELKRKRQPARTWDVAVTGPAALAEMRLGNTYPLLQVSSGFYMDGQTGADGRVRAIGMLWSDATQELRLNVEEVTE